MSHKQLRTLIGGIAGQDGAYLTNFLLDKGYEVIGTSFDSATANRLGLKSPGIDGRVKNLSMAPNDFRSVLQIITRVAPDEIYKLAGQISVELPFDQPAEAIESIAIGVLTPLELGLQARHDVDDLIRLMAQAAIKPHEVRARELVTTGRAAQLTPPHASP